MTMRFSGTEMEDHTYLQTTMPSEADSQKQQETTGQSY